MTKASIVLFAFAVTGCLFRMTPADDDDLAVRDETSSEGNTFSVSIDGDASLRMEVDAPCIEATTVNGPSARVRLEPA